MNTERTHSFDVRYLKDGNWGDWITLLYLPEDEANKAKEVFEKKGDSGREYRVILRPEIRIKVLEDMTLDVFQPKYRTTVSVLFKKDVILRVKETGRYSSQNDVWFKEFRISDFFETDGIFKIAENLFTVEEN